MPTSGTGTCNRPTARRSAPAPRILPAAARGFTLIEIIVVVLIIGVIVSFASLALRGSVDDTLAREAERLTVLMRSASDLAVMRSREYGLLVDEGAYLFLELGDEGWQIPTERGFDLHELPETFKLTLRSEGTEIVARRLSEEAPQIEEDPQILMMSNSDITPFELELSSFEVETRWRIGLDQRGEIALEPLR
jgi:general secretion pathway protein H